MTLSEIFDKAQKRGFDLAGSGVISSTGTSFTLTLKNCFPRLEKHLFIPFPTLQGTVLRDILFHSIGPITQGKIMPKVQQLLIEAFACVAKREAHKIFKPVKAQFTAMRKIIREQAKRIHGLEKMCLKRSTEPKKTVSASIPEKPLRITAERIARLRSKLGLSQSDFASLLGVSAFSITHWESGKAVPREAQKRRIAEVRDLGKRELAKHLAEKGISPASPKKKAIKTVPSAPPAEPVPIEKSPAVVSEKPVPPVKADAEKTPGKKIAPKKKPGTRKTSAMKKRSEAKQ